MSHDDKGLDLKSKFLQTFNLFR